MGYGVTRGKMFYYDSVLKENESNFDWEKALKYLDLLYVKKHSEQIAATIVLMVPSKAKVIIWKAVRSG